MIPVSGPNARCLRKNLGRRSGCRFPAPSFPIACRSSKKTERIPPARRLPPARLKRRQRAARYRPVHQELFLWSPSDGEDLLFAGDHELARYRRPARSEEVITRVSKTLGSAGCQPAHLDSLPRGCLVVWIANLRQKVSTVAGKLPATAGWPPALPRIKVSPSAPPRSSERSSRGCDGSPLVAPPSLHLSAARPGSRSA